MLIVGAKGFARELLQVLEYCQQTDSLSFYDDINIVIDKVYNKFPVLHNEIQAKSFFKKNGSEFTLGIGSPHLRYKVYKKFIGLSGKFTSVISPKATLGTYEVKIGDGCNILDNAVLSNSTILGMGCLVYYNVIITHDCQIGNFVELSPGCILLGNSFVDDFTHIGANATILPNVRIGKNVSIGAGAVVNRDIPDNCVAVGVPAKIIKYKNI